MSCHRHVRRSPNASFLPSQPGSNMPLRAVQSTGLPAAASQTLERCPRRGGAGTRAPALVTGLAVKTSSALTTRPATVPLAPARWVCVSAVPGSREA